MQLRTGASETPRCVFHAAQRSRPQTARRDQSRHARRRAGAGQFRRKAPADLKAARERLGQHLFGLPAVRDLQRTELAGRSAIVTSYRPSPADIKGEDSGEGMSERQRQYDIYRCRGSVNNRLQQTVRYAARGRTRALP